MADAIGPANISHNSGQQIIRVFSASLSGDRGRTAAAAEGPWSYPPFGAFQGLSQTSSPSSPLVRASKSSNGSLRSSDRYQLMARLLPLSPMLLGLGMACVWVCVRTWAAPAQPLSSCRRWADLAAATAQARA